MTEMNNKEKNGEWMKDIQIAAGIGVGGFAVGFGTSTLAGMATVGTIIAGAGWVAAAAKLAMDAKKNAENDKTNNQALKDKGEYIVAKISNDDNTTLENKVAQKRPNNVTLG